MAGKSSTSEKQLELAFEKRPLGEKYLIEAIRQKVVESINRARSHYGIFVPPPELDFALKGSKAGQFRWLHSHQAQKLRRPFLRFNLAMAMENQDDFLKQVVPHEVAHLITVAQWGKVRPHGREWQKVMQECFGLQPDRCHSYNVRGHVKRWPRHYIYACSCREFAMTTMMHNRLQKGQRRRCRKCKGELVFVRKV